jgi:arsenate reductase
MKYTYYHNPKCSKSRLGLELLNENNIDFEIKEYLKEGLEKEEVLGLFTKLSLSPLDGVIRVKEALFKELDLKGKDLSDEEWAQVLADNPKLLERPILVAGKKAEIGRPTENLSKLI